MAKITTEQQLLDLMKRLMVEHPDASEAEINSC